jgi:HEPN domain-containing protein
MSFVSREIEKLNRALREAPEGDRRAELYAAQQALAWALEPCVIQAPSVTISGNDQEYCSYPLPRSL